MIWVYCEPKSRMTILSSGDNECADISSASRLSQLEEKSGAISETGQSSLWNTGTKSFRVLSSQKSANSIRNALFLPVPSLEKTSYPFCVRRLLNVSGSRLRMDRK
jgi:hypothetical protein